MKDTGYGQCWNGSLSYNRDDNAADIIRALDQYGQ